MLNGITRTQPTLVGLGHALRKQGKWNAARAAYEQALALVPRNASTLSAIAFTAQLAGDNSTAIDFYHHALGLSPDDRHACTVWAVLRKTKLGLAIACGLAPQVLAGHAQPGGF